MGWFGPSLGCIWADVSAANVISLFKLLGILAVNAPEMN
jgi:hypothetical protein